MIAALLGPPGSGKGTQAEFLVKGFGLAHVSTGNLLRAEAKAGTDLGRAAAEIMETGELVPDDMVVRMVEHRLQQRDVADVGALLDGFPRTVPQAEALTEMLKRTHHQIDVIVCLDVPVAVLEQRIMQRAEKEGRSDDTAISFEQRMREYTEKTVPVIDYYRANGMHIVSVNGDMAIEDVGRDVAAAVTGVAQLPANDGRRG